MTMKQYYRFELSTYTGRPADVCLYIPLDILIDVVNVADKVATWNTQTTNMAVSKLMDDNGNDKCEVSIEATFGPIVAYATEQDGIGGLDTTYGVMRFRNVWANEEDFDPIPGHAFVVARTRDHFMRIEWYHEPHHEPHMDDGEKLFVTINQDWFLAA